jgi:flagellar biosynthetic protein FliR
MELPLSSLFSLGLIWLRCGGVCVAAPIFGARVIPTRVRVALALWLGMSVFLATRPITAVPTNAWTLASLALQETLLGLMVGWVARLALDTARIAGQLAADSMGLGFGAMLEPLSGADSNAVGEWFGLLATATAMAMGLHREMLVWLVESVGRYPPGHPFPWDSLGHALMTHVFGGIQLAVRLALPLLAASLTGHVLMGVLGRVSPQLNLGNIGFAFALLAGGSALFWLGPDVLARSAAFALRATREF